nr:transposase [Wolbachia endosymbiont of Mansonella ozzardi]
MDYKISLQNRAIKERIQIIIAEVPEEMGIKIENGVISFDYLHLLVVIPPHVAVSDFVQRLKLGLHAKFNKNFQS